MEDFIEILNDLIASSGLTLRRLEKESGVSAMQYSRYLNGSTPTIDIVVKIANYFGVTIDYLFGLEDKNSRNYNSADYDITNFVDKYEKLLKQNNISHYKFAKFHNFNESIIRHWKNGKTPRLNYLYLIAKHLSSSIDELIGRI